MSPNYWQKNIQGNKVNTSTFEAKARHSFIILQKRNQEPKNTDEVLDLSQVHKTSKKYLKKQQGPLIAPSEIHYKFTFYW